MSLCDQKKNALREKLNKKNSKKSTNEHRNEKHIRRAHCAENVHCRRRGGKQSGGKESSSSQLSQLVRKCDQRCYITRRYVMYVPAVSLLRVILNTWWEMKAEQNQHSFNVVRKLWTTKKNFCSQNLTVTRKQAHSSHATETNLG